MGQVFRAEHLSLHSPVAIKLISEDLMQNQDGVNRFMREAHAAASIRSPHVVQILDFGVDQGFPYIAMELLEGESLAGRLGRLGRISPAETARIMTHVGRAMTRAHEAGVVHRDLKPDNIFLVQNEEEELTKVLDFGIAKSTAPGPSGSQGTRTGAVLGTPDYMSPEQAEGARTVDLRTDIWAMGVITFECIVGRRPFLGESFGTLLLAICARELPIPSQINADVPPGFDAWFGRCCARAPEHRYATAREAVQALRQVCEGARPASSPNLQMSAERTIPVATPLDLPSGQRLPPPNYAPPNYAPPNYTPANLPNFTPPNFTPPNLAPAQTWDAPPPRTGPGARKAALDTNVPLSVTERELSDSSSGLGAKLAIGLAALALLGGGGLWYALSRGDETTDQQVGSPTQPSTTVSGTPSAAPSATTVELQPTPDATPTASPDVSVAPTSAAPPRPATPRTPAQPARPNRPQPQQPQPPRDVEAPRYPQVQPTRPPVNLGI